MAQSLKRKPITPNLFETRDLIRLVKERKCLWDRFDPDYRDKTLKETSWLEIYKTIEPDYDYFSQHMKNLIGAQITKKWYNVRDSFVKSKKHGSNSRNKPYIYSKLLTFLEPVYFEDKEGVKADESAAEQQWLNEVFVIDDDEEAKRQNMELDKTENEENVVNILANLLSKEEDDDRAFFRSITPAVKRLSEDSRMEFRIEVMNLLQALKNKEKEGLKCEKSEEIQSEMTE